MFTIIILNCMFAELSRLWSCSVPVRGREEAWDGMLDCIASLTKRGVERGRERGKGEGESKGEGGGRVRGGKGRGRRRERERGRG